jgi:hypothetical protein
MGVASTCRVEVRDRWARRRYRGDDEWPTVLETPAVSFETVLSEVGNNTGIDSINGARSVDTRRRRIDKSVALFVAGKQR